VGRNVGWIFNPHGPGVFSSRAGRKRATFLPTQIPSMKTPKNKKQWITPSVKVVMIFFECTSYAGAV